MLPVYEASFQHAFSLHRTVGGNSYEETGGAVGRFTGMQDRATMQGQSLLPIPTLQRLTSCRCAALRVPHLP